MTFVDIRRAVSIIKAYYPGTYTRNYGTVNGLASNLEATLQSYPGYPNTFGQRGFISCSDKRNCSDNPNETFLAIYILL